MDAVSWQQRFERWIDKFGGELYQSCLARVGGRRPLAEELLHETYLVAWRRRDTFSGPDSGARPWLFRIAFNLAPKVWKKNPITEDLSSDLLEHLPAETWPSSSDDFHSQKEIDRLTKGFARLEPQDQTILRIRFGLLEDPEAQDCSAAPAWADIAELLSEQTGQTYTAGQVRMRARRALQSLHDCFEQDSSSERDGPSAPTLMTRRRTYETET